RDLSEATPEELAAVPGLGGLEAAGRIIKAAAAQVALEQAQARRDAEVRARLAEEARKSPQDRLLSVRGVGPQTVAGLAAGGYTTVEAINAEEDVEKLATSTGIGQKKALQLKHWVKVYLGEIDASTPPPAADEDGESERAMEAEPK